MLRLALDAMGGDLGPTSVVEGACLFLKEDSSVSFNIFGDEAQIKPLIPGNLSHKFQIIHTPDIVTPDMKPSMVLRRGRSTSMALSISSVVNKETLGVVSGGNTGAFMVLCLYLMGNLPGVFRPAIAAFFPTKNGHFSTMLDLGANSENDEIHLIQFAIMGEILAKTALHIENPRIGLLNIGSEELKGNPTIQKAYNLMKTIPAFENFYGFVEGNQIMSGDVDVTVTDGFTGNIALKALEGAVHMVAHELRVAFKTSFFSKLSALLSKPSFKRLKSRIDPANYNGAIFLGVKGIAVKSHGGATAQGFASAIRATKTMAGMNLIEKLEERLQDLPPEFLKK